MDSQFRPNNIKNKGAGDRLSELQRNYNGAHPLWVFLWLVVWFTSRPEKWQRKKEKNRIPHRCFLNSNAGESFHNKRSTQGVRSRVRTWTLMDTGHVKRRHAGSFLFKPTLILSKKKTFKVTVGCQAQIWCRKVWVSSPQFACLFGFCSPQMDKNISLLIKMNARLFEIKAAASPPPPPTPSIVAFFLFDPFFITFLM